MRDARVEITIDGVSEDLQDVYSIYLVDSPDILNAPLKSYETEQYPESAGYYIYPYTTEDGFDYKLSFVYFGAKETANQKISDLREKMFDKTGDLMQAKEISVWNKYKGVVIVGLLKSLDGNDTDFDADNDAWFFDLVIQVSDPNKCNFNFI